ncbi:MAG: CvpA family protein [Proteobacteria bacterium]|nr:CvpA family protein [Pseudomonadota bacterium]
MVPNILDFAILVFIGACFLLSSLKGGVELVFSFFVTVLSFMLAGRFYESFADLFPTEVFPPSFAEATGFTAAFLLIFGLISITGRYFDNLFNRLHFGGIDRVVSVALGLLKGFTLACMMVVIIMVNYPADCSIVTDSVSAPYITPAARVITTLLPQEEQKRFHAKEKELKRIWQKQRKIEAVRY